MMCKTSGTTGIIKEVIKAPNRQNDFMMVWGFLIYKDFKVFKTTFLKNICAPAKPAILTYCANRTLPYPCTPTTPICLSLALYLPLAVGKSPKPPIHFDGLGLLIYETSAEVFSSTSTMPATSVTGKENAIPCAFFAIPISL